MKKFSLNKKKRKPQERTEPELLSRSKNLGRELKHHGLECVGTTGTCYFSTPSFGTYSTIYQSRCLSVSSIWKRGYFDGNKMLV